MFDIDHFKHVNDTHGHAAGDQVLASIGRVLAREVRQFDIVARWGGEEFLALLPHATAEEARVIAERLRCKVHAAGSSAIPVTISAGVAILDQDDTLETVIARADGKLYEAKRAGRDVVR